MIFKCGICENVFDSARGLTLHSKACTKSNKKKELITGVRTESKHYTSLQEYSTRSLLPNLDNEANILESIMDENNQDGEENFTDSHNCLINQESEYNARNNRDGHNLWSPSDLAKLSLLKILHKHNCHNNAFEDILKWASHCNNVSGSDIFKYARNTSRRETFLDNLCDRRNMQKMKPIKKKISLENNHFIEVTTFDFKQQLLSMFRDTELMDPQNLVLEEPGTVQNSHDNLGNSDHISDIRDSEWYKCAYEHYNEKLGSNKNRVICGIILTVDKTHTDWKGKLCLEPVHFSLSIFNKETRKKDYTAWRCLGFVNDLDAYSSSRFFIDDMEYFPEINIFDAKSNEEHDIDIDNEVRTDWLGFVFELFEMTNLSYLSTLFLILCYFCVCTRHLLITMIMKKKTRLTLITINHQSEESLNQEKLQKRKKNKQILLVLLLQDHHTVKRNLLFIIKYFQPFWKVYV